MIEIHIAVSDSGAREGRRISRFHDQEDGHEIETQKEFAHRKKKRKKRPKQDLAVPYRQDVDDTADRLTVTKTNWLGRLERDPPPKRSRIKRVRS